MLSHFHRVAAPGGAAARMAIEAGIDLEAGSEEYRHAERMVREGFLDEKHIDRAVGNILFAKFASGLFDGEPADTLGWRRKIHAPEAVRLARQIADESAVLLENRNGVLPLSPGKLRSSSARTPTAYSSAITVGARRRTRASPRCAESGNTWPAPACG